MSIPLVEIDKFELIKVTSFPHRLPNGIYSFILPEYEYIAIDKFREKFVALTTQNYKTANLYAKFTHR